MDRRFKIEHFFHPPDAFGIVSFYWWVGDKLEKERLLWQLDQLAGMDICGLQINYCHRDWGGQIYGLPYESDPKQFTDPWWALFSWFLEEAEKRGISVSLSDYTLGTAGQGYYVDEILEAYPHLRGGELSCTAIPVQKGDTFQAAADPDRVALVAYPLVESVPSAAEAAVLEPGRPFTAGDRDYIIADIGCKRAAYSIDPMHPDAGRAVIQYFFQRFEDHNPGKAGKALNFFFSDELSFGVRGNLWNDNFRAAFLEKKGYDVVPFLYGLFADIGAVTQKVRLDYYDVVVSLEEENYFAPIYQWHEERGMTYGCDHGGRGYDVTEFGDYFRTQKYNQGPGNDQPGLASDVIKNKVASSIAHLYDRPRTWLEGFYGSGWGTSSGEVWDAVCRNFAMGHNLLSLHGLYYTTHGGFWEWAPPCNHFRMPYWKAMKGLTSGIKRLSYLNTRGVHQCDAAILYPVAAVEGGLDGQRAVDTAFSLGRYLYSKGVDFDFMDFQSLDRAEVRNGKLFVAGKAYRALVVPSMRTVRWGNLLKLMEWKKAGGLVLCMGDRPEASDRAGRADGELDRLVQTLFPHPLEREEEVLAAMDGAFPRDFQALEAEDAPFFQHRLTDRGDLYFIYGLPKGTRCFFRAKGYPLLLEPLEGKIYSLPAGDEEGEGTFLPLPLERTQPQILLFAKERADYPMYPACTVESEIALGDTWRCELVPSMDNTYGDFALPAFDGMIGAQIRRAAIDGTPTTLGFGPYCRVTGPLSPDGLDGEEDRRLLTDPENAGVEFFDYRYSLRFGKEDDPGRQGWHGLKERITDEYLTFGRQVDRHHQYDYEEEVPGGVYYFYTYVYAPQAQRARLLTGSLRPDVVFVNRKPMGQWAELNAGYNLVTARFSGTGRTYLLFEREAPAAFTQTVPLAMTWYKNPNILPMDSRGGREKIHRIAFHTPPGCRKLTFRATGELEADIDGCPVVCRRIEGDAFVMETTPCAPTPQRVQLTLRSQTGCWDDGMVYGYIDCECGPGEMRTGDWGESEGLAFYSGGIRYTQTICLPPLEEGRRVWLDLGEVVSAAVVEINGRPAGSLAAPPFRLDITDFMKDGENDIGVTVYNTLYNHYRTIPTKYNRRQASGLLGPVKIKIGREAKA